MNEHWDVQLALGWTLSIYQNFVTSNSPAYASQKVYKLGSHNSRYDSGKQLLRVELAACGDVPPFCPDGFDVRAGFSRTSCPIKGFSSGSVHLRPLSL